MYREPENPLFAFVDAFVDELARAGVRHAVICPGSRSTPLAYAFARNGSIKIWMQYDERSAGFFALGMAKAGREAVALLCTSGTAAANFFPAVVEAQISRVPLLVLTADRPHELRDNGAPQAIDQIKIFGSYVKWFAELMLPEATDDGLQYARTVAGRATGTALAKPAGPVHLNFPFREPLIPTPAAMPPAQSRKPLAWLGREESRPYVSLSQGERRLDDSSLEKLAHLLSGVEQGVIIGGPMEEPELPSQLAKLAAALGWPVLADPLSGLRSGSHEKALVIDNYDAFLRDETVLESLKPEMVLRFGAMPTAKPVLLWLKRFPECRQLVVDGGDGWPEPMQLAEEIIHAAPTALCRDLLPYLRPASKTLKPEYSGWLKKWLVARQITAGVIENQMARFEEPFEGKVFVELNTLLPDNAILFVGNSMPVRDLDTFFGNTSKNIRTMCNRGANGIDGVVSSALGAAAATGQPLALVIGDLSFYHDMNGLLAAKLHGLNATIILLNNDGGGIFSFLPQAAYPENFEQLFGTPHGLEFEPAARMYGADYRQVQNWTDFRREVSESFDRDGLKILEMRTNRAENVTQHRRFWPAIAEKLKTEL
jgi:2-succinyl-5-enolpyruvyl-6-hydroxy-3-cyclohexene-1-carboxylate synthase